MSFLAITLAGIFLLTLTPLPELQQSERLLLAWAPALRSGADSLANVILFLPVGAALALLGGRPLPVALAGALVSLSIETVQYVLPGRHSSFPDVCTNTLGAFVGCLLVRSPLRSPLERTLAACGEVWERMKRPDAATARYLMVAATGITSGMFLLTWWLFSPVIPPGRYLVAGKDLDAGQTPLRIGGDGETAGWFSGDIDEVRIYSRALSGVEILEDMDHARGGGQPPPPGLSAFYALDEQGGDRALDTSGNGNHGLVRGAARVAGRFGGALKFDGRSSQVVVPHAVSLNLQSGMTLAAWIRPDGGNGPFPAVISKGGSPYFLYAGTEGTLVLNGGGTFGGANESVEAPRVLPPGVWSHVAVSYDGSALSCYLDGRLVANSVRWFPGHIDETVLGTTRLLPGAIDTAWVTHALASGAVVRLRGTAGEPASHTAAMVDIQRDRSDRPRGDHILLLAVRREDLVVRFYTRGESLRLPAPEIRIGGAFRGTAPGSPLEVEFAGTTAGVSVAVNGTVNRVAGLTLGRGWALQLSPEFLPGWMPRVLDLAWMAAWLFPVGFWRRSRPEVVAAVAVLGAVVLAPTLAGVLALPPPAQMAAGVLGLLAGMAVRSRMSLTTESAPRGSGAWPPVW